MALADGTNCGLVATAPTEDPDGATAVTTDGYCRAYRVTLPANAALITEMGWYRTSGTASANGDMGWYTHNSTDNIPDALQDVSRDVAYGTTAGWKVLSSLTWDVSAQAGNEIWLAFQMDVHVGASTFDYTSGSTGYFAAVDTTFTGALNDPWAGAAPLVNYFHAIYAIVSTSGGGGASVVPIINSYRMRRN